MGFLQSSLLVLRGGGDRAGYLGKVVEVPPGGAGEGCGGLSVKLLDLSFAFQERDDAAVELALHLPLIILFSGEMHERF